MRTTDIRPHLLSFAADLRSRADRHELAGNDRRADQDRATARTYERRALAIGGVE